MTVKMNAKFNSLYMKLSKCFAVISGIIVLCSCASTKNVAYFQNADQVDFQQSRMLYDAKIMPKDVLSITVSTSNPEAAKPFNLSVPTTFSSSNSTLYTNGQLQSYLVDNDGRIDFPIVGSLKVGGLTKGDCEQLIRAKILPYRSNIPHLSRYCFGVMPVIALNCWIKWLWDAKDSMAAMSA